MFIFNLKKLPQKIENKWVPLPLKVLPRLILTSLDIESEGSLRAVIFIP